ncbi:hypothetical protein RSOL_401570 [Rhizoctonia solani AG-3 Rhs1AP]|uniref:Uncharacterized protein n=2 Tax=Rhizoctonia solani AG-3 TaxID=1086053 RepID=A0A074RS35_9AGAM|nr:hypothetical protein RSOL_401570 [Rhizoctonia solani AG-3 Rhs1AP]KEP49911.1 hypothetical protein V565_090530 [Rhizoctonia solani 123E]
MLGLEAFVILAVYTSMALAAPPETDNNLRSLGTFSQDPNCPPGLRLWHWPRQNVCLPFMKPLSVNKRPPPRFTCPDGWYWMEHPNDFEHCIPTTPDDLKAQCPFGYSWSEDDLACTRTPRLHHFFPLTSGFEQNSTS